MPAKQACLRPNYIKYLSPLILMQLAISSIFLCNLAFLKRERKYVFQRDSRNTFPKPYSKLIRAVWLYLGLPRCWMLMQGFWSDCRTVLVSQSSPGPSGVCAQPPCARVRTQTPGSASLKSEASEAPASTTWPFLPSLVPPVQVSCLIPHLTETLKRPRSCGPCCGHLYMKE